jgi:hypothetical protein
MTVAVSTAVCEQQPVQEAGPLRIRPFEARDIPQLVGLYRAAFASADPDVVAEKIRSAFLEACWIDPEIPSLVQEDASGAIKGFMGVTPRPMSFKSVPIRIAVPSVFMVHPESRGRAGLALVRQFMAGPQDLSLTRNANPTSRAIGLRMGWQEALTYTFSWTRPLRPLAHRVTEFADVAESAPLRRVRRIAERVAPFASVPVDALLGRWVNQSFQVDSIRQMRGEDLDASVMVARLPDVMGRRSVQPIYTEESLNWLLRRFDAKAGQPLAKVVVTRHSGEFGGWFLYQMSRRRVAHLIQFAASPGRQRDVFQYFLYHAWSRGAVAAEGQGDPVFLDMLDSRRSWYSHRAPGLLVYSKNTDLLNAIHRGDAFLSRLEAAIGF